MKDENRNMVMQSLSLYFCHSKMLSKQKCKNALQELNELNFSKMMQAGKQSTKKENILCKFNPALGWEPLWDSDFVCKNLLECVWLHHYYWTCPETSLYHNTWLGTVTEDINVSLKARLFSLSPVFPYFFFIRVGCRTAGSELHCGSGALVWSLNCVWHFYILCIFHPLNTCICFLQWHDCINLYLLEQFWYCLSHSEERTFLQKHVSSIYYKDKYPVSSILVTILILMSMDWVCSSVRMTSHADIFHVAS